MTDAVPTAEEIKKSREDAAMDELIRVNVEALENARSYIDVVCARKGWHVREIPAGGGYGHTVIVNTKEKVDGKYVYLRGLGINARLACDDAVEKIKKKLYG